MLNPPFTRPLRPTRLVGMIALGVLTGIGFYLYAPVMATRPHSRRLQAYLGDPAAHPDWQLTVGIRCGEAPFVMPTTGYLGYGYGDSWQVGQRHQGFDIFSPQSVGQTPVVAAYAGYLTREPAWKSTVIIRVPHDPLAPARQIWVYYTHMATAEGAPLIRPEFPPGTSEQYVAAGTLRGYQGNYSGDANSPVGVHLHFSIVQDDGTDHFKNELRIENTLNPSPYLGLHGSVHDDWSRPVVCPAP